MDDREQRGLVIAATEQLRQKGDTWLVPAHCQRGTYKVVPEPDKRSVATPASAQTLHSVRNPVSTFTPSKSSFSVKP